MFTASQKVYADVLLDLLDPQKTLISHRLFRDSCLLVHGNYLKDLSVLQRDMKTVRIIYLFYSILICFGVFLSGTFSSSSNFFLVMCCLVYSVLFHPILFLIFILFLLFFFSDCIILIFDNFFSFFFESFSRFF